MSRRLQFSLRALIAVMALASLPLGAYSYFRAQLPIISISREKAGKPVIIRAKFFRASLEPCMVSLVFGCYDDHPDPDYCPPVRYTEVQRSFGVFCEAETTMMPWRTGHYYLIANLPDREVRQEFIVETIE